MSVVSKRISCILISVLIGFISILNSDAQQRDSIWTLENCIKYALDKNITIKKTELTSLKYKYSKENIKAERFPSVNASIGQNLGWSKSLNINNEYGNYSNSNNTSYSLNSNITLFNGNKLNNNIKASELNLQISQYDSETMKETISLNVLDAYLQVLYAEEQVINSQKQIEATTEQLRLTEERLRLNGISRSDYLQVKSQLASEKVTLANAQSLLATDRVTLMQLLELPVNDKFSIAHPYFGDSINQKRRPNAENIFLTSVAIKPQIKSAEIKNNISKLDVKLAEADYYPSLSMNAGLSTGYSNLNNDLLYTSQVSNNINPMIGLSLLIPIYQNKQVYTRVKIAEIETQNTELDLKDTKNKLRKLIEQACVDVTSAEVEYEATIEEHNASAESYLVSKEKYDQGLINFVDFLIQKTNLISAESNLLQSKYKLIFNYKILDFYSGKQLAL